MNITLKTPKDVESRGFDYTVNVVLYKAASKDAWVQVVFQSWQNTAVVFTFKVEHYSVEEFSRMMLENHRVVTKQFKLNHPATMLTRGDAPPWDYDPETAWAFAGLVEELDKLKAEYDKEWLKIEPKPTEDRFARFLKTVNKMRHDNT